MNDSTHDVACLGTFGRSLLVVLAGLGVCTLPEPAAIVAGLVLLYAIGGFAVVAGVMNLANAFRVRESARWLLPASLAALALGLAVFAAPNAVASVLTRIVGAVVVMLGAVPMVSAIRRVPAPVLPSSAAIGRRPTRI